MLQAEQRAALASLRAHWPEARIVLIGAGAIRAQRVLVRSTADLDLVIAVAADDFPGPLATDPQWSPHMHMPQRWLFRGEMPFDLLPVGEEAIARGELSWTRDIVMSVEGFDLLLTHDLPMLVEEAQIRVATIPIVALLKMIAWLDRPADRQRDISDLIELMGGYLDSNLDADFDRLVAAGFDEFARARLLGEDIAKLGRLGAATRFMSKLENDCVFMWTRERGVSCDEDPLFSAFKRGLGL